MTWKDAFEFSSAIVVSLGGGSGIVFVMSSYLGKLWADRALEREKNSFSRILQDAKSELDRATNLYQVQLDSSTHLNQLRTNEEFSRLGHLWKHVAILQNAINSAAGDGLMIVPAVAERSKQFKALRAEYEKALIETRQFFLEEKLFVPFQIAGQVETVLGQAIKEKISTTYLLTITKSVLRASTLRIAPPS